MSRNPSVCPMTPTLRDVLAVLDRLYDPAWAEPWDKVGPVTGDPEQPVGRILFAVDAVRTVVEEAVEIGADLVVVHHPLLFTPVSTLATPKGRIVAELVRNGIALVTAHTNADAPVFGTNDSIARALGLLDVEVLLPADPGGTGVGTRGHGRIGRLAEPTTLRAFSERVAKAFPATAGGVRVAGDPEAAVVSVALGAGAGDSLLDLVAGTRADVYVTSDLRHHPAQDFVEATGKALVDVAHWAAEWSWLPVAEEHVMAGLNEQGYSVESKVSRRITDPWNFRV